MARARATDQDALIRSAARVFRSKGYSNATIDDIADAAGISRPTVYSYAKGKRWLLDHIVLDLLDEMASLLATDLEVGETAYERLRAVIGTHVASSITNRRFYAILFSEKSELSPAVRSYYRDLAHQTTAAFRQLLEGCITQTSRETALDSIVAANLIVSMLTSIHRWYDPKGPLKPKQLTEQILLVINIPDRPPPQQAEPTRITESALGRQRIAPARRAAKH